MEELHQLNDHKVQTEHVENIPGSQLEPQNGFQENTIDPSVGNDGLAKPSSEEPDTKEISDVGLSIHNA